MNFFWAMFVAMVLGSFFGVVWPVIVATIKVFQPNSTPKIRFLANDASTVTKAVAYLVMALIAGGVIAAITFATFLGTKENQATLEQLGAARYFLAFTAGFTAGAAFEEPLRK